MFKFDSTNPVLKQVGQLYGTEKEPNPQAGRIYNPDGLCPTMDTCSGGNRMPKIVEPVICASRGRNPENPSSRKVGEPTEQRIEVNTSGCSNTLTTVQKDNYVLEPKSSNIINSQFIVGSTQKNAAVNYEGVCPTLTSAMGVGGGHVPMHNYDFRIRKLTPRECWCLMGFKDKYFDRVKGVSNTQLYKQAGNSIVVDVLKSIFEELHNQYPEYFIKDEWGDDL